jgi:hypothetical protein
VNKEIITGTKKAEKAEKAENVEKADKAEKSRIEKEIMEKT